jgi:L-arabinose isomerase
LENRKVGMMGFRDMKLYNTLYEGLSLKSKLGVDIEYFEMLEMVQQSEKIKETEVDELLKKIKGEWDFEKPADDDFLKKGIRYYLAIKNISEENGYQAISLKDVDGMKKF